MRPTLLCMIGGLLFIGATNSLKAQNMFTYQDKNGKKLSQAQVDELNKKYQGFLSLEIVQDGPPTLVEVTPPTPQEMKAIRTFRDQETADLKKKWIGKMLPVFSFKSLEGKTLNPKSLQAHQTVFFFWSKNDYASLNQISALNKMRAAYKGKPVQFWAITFEDQVLIKEFLKDHFFSFTQIAGDFSFVMEKMGIMQTPVYLLLDSKGVVRF